MQDHRIDRGAAAWNRSELHREDSDIEGTLGPSISILPDLGRGPGDPVGGPGLVPGPARYGSGKEQSELRWYRLNVTLVGGPGVTRPVLFWGGPNARAGAFNRMIGMRFSIPITHPARPRTASHRMRR